MKIKLGSVAEDRHTGFKGTVMGITEYLYGCRRYALLPSELTEDGEIPEWVWLDEPRLVGVGTVKKAGGPRPDAPKR